MGSHIGVINRCLREVSLNIDADILSRCGNDFKRSIPVRPAARALCLEGEIRSVNLADAVAVRINDTGIIQKLLGAVNITAGKLIILQSVIVDVRLTQRIVRSNNAAGIFFKGRRLTRHCGSNDLIIINCHGNRLADRRIVKTRLLAVKERGRSLHCEIIRSVIQPCRDFKSVLLPQVLDICRELLRNINLALAKSGVACRIVLVYRVRDILRNRELAPHGICLAPVIVVADEDNLLIVVDVRLVRTRCYEIIHAVGRNLVRILSVSFLNLLQICLLHLILIDQILLAILIVDRLAIIIEGHLNGEGRIIDCLDGIDERAVCAIACGVVLLVSFPGIGDIIRCDLRAVRPLCIRIQMYGHLGVIIVPAVIGREQRLALGGQRIIHHQRLIDKDTGERRCRKDHCVVGVSGQRVIVIDRAPLLAAEIQGLITGKLIGIRRCLFRRR